MPYLSEDEKFMQRALQLAELGRGKVSPNPMVGCVIVHEHKIIGEGWHQRYGGPHAEVNAVNAVPERDLLPHSTAYVTLEPCSHTGKTPPCADMLIREKIKRVVIANVDPNPLVSGTGIERLQAAGIEVEKNLLAEQAQWLNRRFFTFMEKKRPYVILKWAQTADGFVARENFESKWISNEYSRQVVHKWRTEEDAVLVGRQTAAVDNPYLNVRNWSGRNPLRVVLDRQLRLDSGLNLFDGSQRTFRYNLIEDSTAENLSLIRVKEENFLQNVLEHLYANHVQSIIVEGGSTTLQLFINLGIWDESRVFKCSTSFGKGIPAPAQSGIVVDRLPVGDDLLEISVNSQK